MYCRPVVIEVPHFASLRGKEREIVILRSDNGETWREHTIEATDAAIQDALHGSFEGDDDTGVNGDCVPAYVGACTSLLSLCSNYILLD